MKGDGVMLCSAVPLRLTRIHFAVFTFLLCFVHVFGNYAFASGPATDSTNASGFTFTVNCPQPPNVKTDSDALNVGLFVKESNPKVLKPTLTQEFLSKTLGLFSDKNPADLNTTYVFHVIIWASDPSTKAPVIKSSSWYAYRFRNGTLTQKWNPPLNGNEPLLYGAPASQLITVRVLPKGVLPEGMPSVALTYAVALTQKTPENQANLASAITAVLGAGGAAKEGAVETVCVDTLPPFNQTKPAMHLPYDIAITITPAGKTDAPPAAKTAVAPAGKTGAAPAATDAAKSSDSISRTLHALDKEWWDISIAVSIPGVKETQITDVSSKVVSSVVNRVSAYGFFDFYPFFWRWPKNGLFPHVAGGIPLSGQPLHRPFVGLSEPIPLLQKSTTFPISVFGGVVFMRERYPSTLAVGAAADAATFNNNLSTHWVRKALFGADLPLTKLISKINPIKTK